jgi:hypothetical protein
VPKWIRVIVGLIGLIAIVYGLLMPICRYGSFLGIHLSPVKYGFEAYIDAFVFGTSIGSTVLGSVFIWCALK